MIFIFWEVKMKCPKCKYVSFDYNEVCPKCNKELASERRKMNLSGYKPNPPFFLGSRKRKKH
jgi:phage FluMu protein Com